MKRYRQSAILDLVTHESVCSQEELCRRLRARGFHATQATISRDVKELQLVKRAADGAYQKPGVPPGGRDAGGPMQSSLPSGSAWPARLDGR